MDARRLAVIGLALNAVTLAVLLVILGRPEAPAFDDGALRADILEIAGQLDTLERRVQALSTTLDETGGAIGAVRADIAALTSGVDDGLAGLDAELDGIVSRVGQLCDLTDGCWALP